MSGFILLIPLGIVGIFFNSTWDSGDILLIPLGIVGLFKYYNIKTMNF